MELQGCGAIVTGGGSGLGQEFVLQIARAGGAVVLDEKGLTGDRMAEEVLALAADRARRAEMGRRSRTLARPDAAERIADKVRALAR